VNRCQKLSFRGSPQVLRPAGEPSGRLVHADRLGIGLFREFLFLILFICYFLQRFRNLCFLGGRAARLHLALFSLLKAYVKLEYLSFLRVFTSFVKVFLLRLRAPRKHKSRWTTVKNFSIFLFGSRRYAAIEKDAKLNVKDQGRREAALPAPPIQLVFH
jgi:hypothetical protein